MAGTQEKCSLGRFFGKEAECVAAGGICSSRPGRAGSDLDRPGQTNSTASVERRAERGRKLPGPGRKAVTSHTGDNCHELATSLRRPWQGPGNELDDLVRSFPRWWNSFLDQFTICIITLYVSTQLWDEENRSEVNIAERGIRWSQRETRSVTADRSSCYWGWFVWSGPHQAGEREQTEYLKYSWGDRNQMKSWNTFWVTWIQPGVGNEFKVASVCIKTNSF